jgi:hypothetical protein
VYSTSSGSRPTGIVATTLSVAVLTMKSSAPP